MKARPITPLVGRAHLFSLMRSAPARHYGVNVPNCPFALGDVVRPKAGGRSMIVESLEYSEGRVLVRCLLYHGTQMSQPVFTPDALELVPQKLAITTHFPTPWKIMLTEGKHYTVEDQNGKNLIWVYVRNELIGNKQKGYLTDAEAQIVVNAFADMSR
jgi:uncharacterized protein YodC (DUF2158 family)